MKQFLGRISRKTLMIGGIAVGVVLLTGIGLAAAAALHGSPQAANAQSASTPTSSAAAQKLGGHVHLVHVVSVDASKNTITVVAAGKAAKGKEGKRQQRTLTVSGATKITKYGQPAAFKDIQPDEYLLVAGADAQHIQRIAILGYGAAGTIQTISSGGLTIKNAQGQMVSIAASNNTKILEGHMQITLADLQPGEVIAAFGDKNSDGSLNALLIHVHLVHGQVTAITGSTITLSQGLKGNEVTVTTSDATKYYIGGKQVSASTLQAGDTIGVAGVISDKTSVNAVAVFIQGPRVVGKVTAVNGNTITLQTKNGTTWTITVNNDTQYLKDGQPAALSDVQVGSQIAVVGLKTGDNALTAMVVHIHTAQK
jgi:preprotein translocase subunit YajC